MPFYPPSMLAYCRNSLNPHRSNDAYIAVRFVLNYNEGNKNNILHRDLTSETFLSERVEIHKVIRLNTLATGQRTSGCYTGLCSINTVNLATEECRFEYIFDDDDLPYWREYKVKVANDIRFATPQDFNSGDQFYIYLKDSFDVLY